MKSKISVLLTSLLLGFFLTACGGGGDGGGGGGGGDTPPTQRDTPGNIPGFGDTPGTIQGTPFRLPDGVEVGEITLGVTFTGQPTNSVLIGETVSKSYFRRKWDDQLHLSFDDKLTWPTFDASIGGGIMGLTAIFKNKNSTATTIVFPARTVFMPLNAPQAQRLIILKETSATIPPGVEYKVSIEVYCGNHNMLDDMYPEMPYVLHVVANSPLLIDLTDRLVDKKVNIEEYAFQDYTDYLERVAKLQTILHKLTDHGEPLSDEDKQWIEALPRSVR